MNFDYLNFDLTKLNSVPEFISLGVILLLAFGVFWAIKNRKLNEDNIELNKETIETYKENNKALADRLIIVENETKMCRSDHAQSQKDIASLQGEIKAYNDLSLIPKKLVTDLQKNQKEIISMIKECKK
ncbi:hypothetical protein [Polynucleobacter sp.]|uniref:hypothetical protein n=1 Tax=Polynucleobacter sp. TaxID=2029855 RepID=UPI003F694E00